jgi:hypothetical protein
MYRPIIVKLNTNICNVCNKVFKSEKALKDRIFHKRINDKKYLSFKEKIRKKRFENSKLIYLICKQKVRKIGKEIYISMGEQKVVYM